MDFNSFPCFFLGANAAGGFVNKFTCSYNTHGGWKAYIIKGGPGTGKSSFMKRAAERAIKTFEETVLCPCSSDPSSLDAVIFPQRKIVILDGTAPHTVEPLYPAITEQIINTGDFWDESKLPENKEEILSLFSENKGYHKKASSYISAAGQLLKYGFSAELEAADLDKIFKFSALLAKKHLPQTDKKPLEWVRFLSGITPDGFVYFSNTISDYYKTQIVIEDRYFAVSSIILSVIRDMALAAGYEIITVKNALLPEDITDHILIPELSLAFTTENELLPNNSKSRRIHAARFADQAQLKKNSRRLKFNSRLFDGLLSSAAAHLKSAKQTHDKMEKFYTEIMDFEALRNYTDKITDRIFSSR